MKIAITGASGRIGRRVAEMALARGHELVCLDQLPAHESLARQGITFVQSDMADYDALVRAFSGCDALVHMAAIPAPGRHPDHIIHNNNVVGSYNALRAAAENGVMRICQASSVNAIGHAFSRQARYDYFPIDESHPNYSEEPYSLSKWICEQQADAFVRRHEAMTIASMRFHYCVPEQSVAAAIYTLDSPNPGRHLWAWTHLDAAADACLRSLEPSFSGHEVFYIVSPNTVVDVPTRDLAAQHFPQIPITSTLDGNRSFFNCEKARRLLGCDHDAAISVRK